MWFVLYCLHLMPLSLPSPRSCPALLGLAAGFCLLAAPLQAGEFFTDFDEGLPDNTHILNNATRFPSGGLDDSGQLCLTAAARDRQGTFYVDNFDGGTAAAGVLVRFHLRMGGGLRGADGISFVYAHKATVPFGESGTGRGLSIAFNTYVTVDSPSPVVHVRLGSHILKTVEVPGLRTGDRFAEVLLRLETNRTLNVFFDGQLVVEKLRLPKFPAFSDGNFGFGARTGVFTDYHCLDDLLILTVPPGQDLPATLPVRPLAPRQVTAQEIQFFNGTTLERGWLYQPKTTAATVAYPTVVFVPEPQFFATNQNLTKPFPELAAECLNRHYALFVPQVYPAVRARIQELAGTPENDPSPEEALEQLALNLQAALAGIKTHPAVDQEKVFLLGAGSGALLPLLATNSTAEIKGLILLAPSAAPAWPRTAVEETVIRQAGQIVPAVLVMEMPPAPPAPFRQPLHALVEKKGSPSRWKTYPADATNALPPLTVWAPDLFSFIATVGAEK